MKRAEFIEKWLEALESGKYKQIKSRLREHVGPRTFGYCCLGVACDVANKVGARRVDENVLDTKLELPSNMQTLLGMDDYGSFYEPITYKESVYSNLTQMNDSGISFKEIARVIRKQIKEKNFDKP
jgi:hypothetical protein